MSEVYLGNPNLKKANTPIEFTKENIQEFLKCKDDPVYFANNYIKIVSLDEGLVPFKQYPFQKKLIENFHEHRFNICKMPRQTGKSTTVVSYLLHYAIFNDNVNIAILANKASTARDLLGRLQLAYENLPRWMQQGIISCALAILSVAVPSSGNFFHPFLIEPLLTTTSITLPLSFFLNGFN